MSVIEATENKFALTSQLSEEEAARMSANWQYWEDNAHAHRTGHAASWGDRLAMDLETANLLEHLRPGGKWLDAGCGNGYTTFHVLTGRPAHVRAFDFSQTMIRQARTAQVHHDAERRICFYWGNALEIAEPDASIDQAYGVRLLINLPSWEAQQNAIREIHRVLRPGGRYILSEAFEGSQARLNQLRALADLPPLSTPSFNLYLEESKLEGFLEPLFQVETVSRFSSVYYVASRFLRELAVEPDGPADYEHPLNEVAATLTPGSRGGDFGIQKAYVLIKR